MFLVGSGVVYDFERLAPDISVKIKMQWLKILDKCPKGILMQPRTVDIIYKKMESDESYEGQTHTLFCDPLTGLVSYPCFQRFTIDLYPRLLESGFSIAIGDVDGLKDYVQRANSNDPHSFGHLAGNSCMEIIGSITRRWHQSWRQSSVISVCATFGGDEVIVLSQHQDEVCFSKRVVALSEMIQRDAPRPCSFAIGAVTKSSQFSSCEEGYRSMVSTIDRALFRFKDERRNSNFIGGSGRVLDLGVLENKEIDNVCFEEVL